MHVKSSRHRFIDKFQNREKYRKNTQTLRNPLETTLKDKEIRVFLQPLFFLKPEFLPVFRFIAYDNNIYNADMTCLCIIIYVPGIIMSIFRTIATPC